MRIFTAIVPTDEAVDHLDDFLEPRRAAADFRWTRPEHYHVTLAFMPDAAPRRVDDYVDQLAESLDGIDPADLALAGAVVFPNVGEGRVLAAGVTGAVDVLERVAKRARNAAVVCGIEVDGQPLRPHLTIARTRPTELTNWVRLLDDYQGPGWEMSSVAVIASHLGDGPQRSPRYETVAELQM